MRRGWWLGPLLALGSCFGEVPVRAGDASPAQPVWLTGDTHGVLAGRLREELAARGYEVRASESRAGPGALEAPARASVYIDGARRRVEIWITGDEGGPALLRETVTERTPDDDTLAVRAAESVRAYLHHAGQASPEITGAPPTGASAASCVDSESHPRSRASVGIEGTYLMARLEHAPSAALGATAWARRSLMPRLDLGGRLLLPVIPATLDASAGSVSIATTGVALDVSFDPFGAEAGSAWDGSVSAGVGAMWLRFDGAARVPFVGHEVDRWAVLPFGGLEVTRAMAPRIWLRASALVGPAIPTVQIRIAGVAASSWGDPMAAVSLGVRIDL